MSIFFDLKIGGAEAAGFFKEVSGLDSEAELVEPPIDISKREDLELGSSIRGEVTLQSHAKWLQLSSFEG